MTNKQDISKPSPRSHPFRRAVLRGLAILLPPLLTILIFLWIGNALAQYVLPPVKWVARTSLVWVIDDDVEEIPDARGDQTSAFYDGREYHRLPARNGEPNPHWVPAYVYDEVMNRLGDVTVPTTRAAMFRRYVDTKWLTPQIVIPVFLCLLILVMYLLGKFLAAGIGRLALDNFERVIHRLPLIRNVYGSAKQVTDFMFSEREVEYTRVVAIEYPRKGIWSFGLVTGESMLDIRSAANEPVVSLLIPTSPLPMTGYTVTVKKSECIDLDITIDQALQFIVSCGVVVPPKQLQHHFSTHSTTAAPSDRALPAPAAEPTPHP